MEDMLLEAASGWFANWWWLIAPAVAIAILLAVAFGKRSITGKAYVTDGDGIRVAGQDVRLAGLDAPEWDQKAKHRDGYWFNHGKRVKSALIREIGGKPVRVSVEGTDKFGRRLGIVTYKGRDIGEWLVREGHAIAAYGDQYLHMERETREAKRGMWAHAHNFDPRAHRHRERRKG
ncbi:MAG: thermonuclease family protein [Alphaproteobacteria bacterium]|nr:thermonuclease family protein [Alphaproteobacteria bacterium]